MNDRSLQSRLSRITTMWSLVRKAHEDESGSENAFIARNELMERYHGAAYRYLLAAIGNVVEAEELFQEFALRFVRGDFRRADPGRRKFRQYVKTVLINLVSHSRKKRQRNGPQIEALQLDAVDDRADDDSEDLFLANWRDELLANTWEALETSDRMRDHEYFLILQLRTQFPDDSIGDLASRLSDQVLRKIPWSETATRKLLQRAREKFAELLLREVSLSLEEPSLDRVEEELIALDLHKFCRSAIEKRRQSPEK